MSEATTIDTARLSAITTLSQGSHAVDQSAMCVMEAVAYVAGEPWSDHPQCACPVITAFLIAWNDGLPTDDDRKRLLLPLVPRIVNTRSSPVVERRRAVMAADWLIRTYTPAWLRLAKLETQAASLESLPEITDFDQCPSLMPTLNAVRGAAAAASDAAGSAAGSAARAAARAAAGAAARNAAWDAARDAAWAARDAAWDAAWAAAGSAAGSAARAELDDTTLLLQQSGVLLVERMISVTEDSYERSD